MTLFSPVFCTILSKYLSVSLVFQQQQRRRRTTSMDFLCFGLHWLKNYSSLLLCNKWQSFQFFFFVFFEERKEREPLEKWQQQQQQLKMMLCNRQLTILWRHKRIGFVLVIRLATHIDTKSTRRKKQRGIRAKSRQNKEERGQGKDKRQKPEPHCDNLINLKKN